MHDLVLEMAQSKSFWAQAAQSPQNPARTKRPVDGGYFFFFTPPSHGPLNNYMVYLQISNKNNLTIKAIVIWCTWKTPINFQVASVST